MRVFNCLHEKNLASIVSHIVHSKHSDQTQSLHYAHTHFGGFIMSWLKCWLSGLEFTTFLSEKQTGKTLIRLLLQKQSDLGLHCLSMSFWQIISV